MRVLTAAILIVAACFVVTSASATEPPATPVPTTSPKPANDAAPTTLEQAVRLARAGDLDKAIEQAGQAIAADPKNATARGLRAALYIQQRMHSEAVADLTAAIDQAPSPDLCNDRGSELLLLAKFKESIADFDKFIAARPDQGPWHWKRGIACYYAGEFDAGRKQFEGYQTVDDNDVENAVWRYLCMARATGAEDARGKMLKIKNDTRVPMMQVYELFAGKIKPADVLAACEAGKPTAVELNNRLFYAHLYLGLYYETLGEKQHAQQHLSTAADKHRIGHYMWDVARMHADLLSQKAKK